MADKGFTKQIEMAKSFDQLIALAKVADKDKRPATVVEALTAAANFPEGLSSRFELMLADNLRVVGRIADARRILREIKDFPEEKAWLVNVHRGKIEHDAGDFQAAIYRFETAVEQNGGSTVPYIYLACAYSAMQQYDKAIGVLNAARSAKGDQDEVYLNLGYHYRSKECYREAREAFQEALKITPDYTEAQTALRDVNSVLQLLNEE